MMFGTSIYYHYYYWLHFLLFAFADTIRNGFNEQSNCLLYISSRGDIIVMVNWKHCHQLTQTTLILVQPNRNFFVKWNPIQYYKN